MPVNNFEFEKADGIISSVQGQSVGREPISAAGIFNFVSIAQKGFGYEPEEEDMIKVMHGTRDGDTLTFDIKSADIPELLSNGTIIYYYDEENELSQDTPCIFFLIGQGDGTGLWRIATIDRSSTPFSYELSTDADGYLYFYFD